ncbi:hypothetical protein PG993_005871 [Apiospora rasikravindrae]|uniref:Heterokaryon incompatibility domain-containing protein n=1 Tax=Apiospora rasikravindrae TaxID=990691 RepID=A0ABR1TA10_9PEZI
MSTATEPFGRRCPNCIGIGIDDTMLEGSSAELEDGRRYVKFDFEEAWYRVFPLANPIKDSFPTLPVLSASSKDGCTFCAFLKDLFTSGEVFYLFEDIIQGFTERDGLPFDLKLEFQWRFSVESADLDFSQLQYLIIMVIFDETTKVWHDNTHWRNPIQIHCSVQPLPGEDHRNDDVATWLQLERASVPDLLSPETIAGIKQQLSSCYHGIGEHEGVCVTNEPSYFVPTRLIDVRQADLRILSGESISQQSREAGICPSYTALSYCWGKISDVEAEYQTTSQNLEARQTRLEANLPPVLRDAVAVTRALSIPYLWVDAICILQDQLGDWETESARLDKVYATAYVTIVCLTSSCQLGFLQPQKPRTNMAFRSRIDPTISGGYRIEFANCYWHSLPRKGHNDLLPSSRWFSRGWTYQEAWLSSRVLFVGLDFMGISCAAGLFAEGQWTQQGGLQNAMTQTRASDDFGHRWLKTAFYYLDRYLSVPGDALPALSGVAGIFAASMGDDYLAGVWGSDIVRGVLWGYAMPLQSKPPDA